ncbi:hypothetical protein [Solicola gregarius]|uniref:Uncharacterized protein n=1 Tax=Solicola gregarius TaxID=2908642 RepID=A0AA46TIT7_9ACTN|nr:hypothetical protein [Solicola gregarius]UYM05659.1 hypothetical protein L0C25_00840 [Solicola gregarius]
MAFVAATSTVRGLAVAWLVLILAAIVGGAFHLSSDGFDAGGLLGLAAEVAYAGPGYTQYRRAVAGCAERAGS